MKEIRLKPGKERPVLLGHPWIFSGAIHDLPPDIEAGEIVRVCASDGQCVGTGYVNPQCSIAIRIISRQEEAIDEAFLRRRVEAALDLRRRVVSSDSDAYRLINGEGDGLPGFVVDRYGNVLVLQCLTAGAERLKALLVAVLIDLLSPSAIHERSDGSVRRGEGLPASVGLLHGAMPSAVSIHENGLAFCVDPAGGQKTGFFLDQRANRALARAYASGARVLDAFAYSGGFAVHAGAGGAAHVVAVETSESALALAARNWQANGLPSTAVRFERADVRSFLSNSDERFDLLILDPPALVKHRHEVNAGARAYRDLHVRAFRRAERGALVMTFTCSQHVDAELFRRTVVAAAADAGCSVQFLAHLGPGPDHPVLLAHPEGEYLRGLLLRVQ
jgi:23S rRNA (cytosine1962-C5)-methyltransferase